VSEPTTHILVEAGVVTVLRFDRPEKKNAITAVMYNALSRALNDAAADDAVHVVLILGSQGSFTAGNDLKDFLEHPPEGEDSAVFRLLEALRTFPKPLVAAVDGVAIGIGTTLLLHCDLVYASERARFQMPFINLAVTPEGASSYLLPRVVGMQRASQWLFFGEAFGAEEARAAGMINAIVPAAELEAYARNRCDVLAAKVPGALRAAKELLRGPEREAVGVAMSREGAEFLSRIGSPEAVAAFARFLAPKG
jgi:enoyl-CoA hydratase/carnithine racemase